MEADVESLKSKFSDKGEFSLSCFHYYRNILSQYRKYIYNYSFKDTQEEIFFFKEVKQYPQVHVFYYSYLWKYYSTCAVTGEPFKIDLIKKEIEKAALFLKKHLKIFQYKKLNTCCHDTYYFTRPKEENITTSNLSFDILFTSAKDILFSKCEAQEKYLRFLEGELSTMLGREESGPLSKMNWTGSKVDLTELVYALHLSGKIHNGNLTLKELVLYFEKEMGINLGDYHHTFLRLRDRSTPSKFIDSLRSSLLQRMEELDS